MYTHIYTEMTSNRSHSMRLALTDLPASSVSRATHDPCWSVGSALCQKQANKKATKLIWIHAQVWLQEPAAESGLGVSCLPSLLRSFTPKTTPSLSGKLEVASDGWESYGVGQRRWAASPARFVSCAVAAAGWSSLRSKAGLSALWTSKMIWHAAVVVART